MNLFELLILLIIFLAPALGRLFGKKKPAPQRAEPRPTSGEAEDPFGEALRQIREALGEPEPVPEPAPQAKPAPAEPRRLGEPRPKPSFHGTSEHGSGRENPLSEKVFEQEPAFVTKGSTAPIRNHASEQVDLTTPLEVKKPAAADTGPSVLVRLLREPQHAREALILHEVLGPPRSRSRRR